MKTLAWRSLPTLFALATLISVSISMPASRAADHLDSPKIKTNHQLDINDVYVFHSSKNKQSTVLMMTVFPMAGLNGPAVFSTDGAYVFHVDNTGDATDDLVYHISFSAPNKKGVQKFVVMQGTAKHTKIVARGTTGKTAQIAGGGQVQASLYDDPFFFDLNAFNMFKVTHSPSEFCHPGSNFFKGLNVLAIVMEVPSVKLQSSKKNTNIGVWASTLDASGAQFDRMGRPAINTALIPDNLKDSFNAGNPTTDVSTFGSVVANTLTALGNPPETISALSFILPDVNTFDTSKTSGFPNGRELEDDVIDTEFGLILKNAGVTTDCVGNDSTFRNRFPYLGTPNANP